MYNELLQLSPVYVTMCTILAVSTTSAHNGPCMFFFFFIINKDFIKRKTYYKLHNPTKRITKPYIEGNKSDIRHGKTPYQEGVFFFFYSLFAALFFIFLGLCISMIFPYNIWEIY